MNKLLFLTISLFISSTIFCMDGNKMDIHEAAKHGNLEDVQGCLRAGTSVDARDRLVQTPLHLAVAHNQQHMGEFLLNNRACVNSRDWRGQTPLHIAAFHNNVEVALLLLNNGANVKILDTNQRYTALDVSREVNRFRYCSDYNMYNLLSDWNHIIENHLIKKLLLAFCKAVYSRVGQELPVIPKEIYQHIAYFVATGWTIDEIRKTVSPINHQPPRKKNRLLRLAKV